MSQSTTEQQTYTATDLYVPVQRLQGLPKLAKATAAPQLETAAQQPKPWAGIIFVALVWTAVVAMAFDLLYGGADVRAMQAQATTATQQAIELQQQNAELQQGYQHQAQAINTAAAALGCPTGGPVQ